MFVGVGRQVRVCGEVHFVAVGVVLADVLVHIFVYGQLSDDVIGVGGSTLKVVKLFEVAAGIFLFRVVEGEVLFQFRFHCAVKVGVNKILDVLDCVLRLIRRNVLGIFYTIQLGVAVRSRRLA